MSGIPSSHESGDTQLQALNRAEAFAPAGKPAIRLVTHSSMDLFDKKEVINRTPRPPAIASRRAVIGAAFRLRLLD